MNLNVCSKSITFRINQDKINIPVIYEDQWLLVANKPTDMLAVPSPARKKNTPSLTEILNEDLKKKNLPYRLHPCHRLDRETSGLIIYAKGKSVQKKMMQLFRQKEIKKNYIAFIHGCPAREAGRIDFAIENERAYTEYKVIGKRQKYSIVEVVPHTGKTNQIRIHFLSIGHPLVGEKKFAFRRDFELRANRLCLHAKALKFTHPITAEPVAIDTELPLGMKNFLNKHPQ